MPDEPGSSDLKLRLRRLLQAIERPAQADCQACLDALDDYIVAQLKGENYAAAFPEVALHLDRCLDCSGAYARLYEESLAEQLGMLPQPAALPAPDLSFLEIVQDRKVQSQPPTLFERLNAALQQAGDLLTFRFSAEILSLLQPGPDMAPVRAAGQEERYGELLFEMERQEIGRPGFPFSIRVYRDSKQPELCLLEVTVAPPGRSWPDLGGIEVTLKQPGERRTAVTGAWGLVSFEAVPAASLPRLALEIRLGEPGSPG